MLKYNNIKKDVKGVSSLFNFGYSLRLQHVQFQHWKDPCIWRESYKIK